MLCVLKCFMASIHRQSSEELTFSFIKTLPQSLWYVSASGTNVLFYCQMTGSFLKYILPFFIILLQEITFNQYHYQISTRKREKNVFTHLHYIRVVLLHIKVVCFEHTATWKGCYDMRKVCGNIFEGCTVQQKLFPHVYKIIFSWNLQLYNDIYIGICWIF